jgi:hypothetical protein
MLAEMLRRCLPALQHPTAAETPLQQRQQQMLLLALLLLQL